MPTDPKSSRRWTTAFIALLALALGLRLFHLGAQSFWSDEGVTVAHAHLDLRDLPRTLTYDVHPPLYYAVMHFWVAAFGDSEFSLRLPSVLMNVFMIALIGTFLRRAANGTVALLAVGWLACSAFENLYAQEARSHTMVALMLTLSTLCLWDWLVEPRGSGVKRPIVWLLSSLGCMYANYFGYLLLPLQTLMLAATGTLRTRWKTWLVGCIAAVACLLPWDLYVASHLFGLARGQGYEADVSIGASAVVAMLGDLSFSHDFSNPQLALERMGGLLVCSVLAVGTVCVLGARYLWRSDRRGLAVWLGLWLVGPVAMTVFVQDVLRLDVFVNKYFILCTPALAALFAAGLYGLASQRAAGRLAAVALGAAWLGLNLVSWAGYTEDPGFGNQDWRGVARVLRQNSTPTDVVVVQPAMMIYTLIYYYRGPARIVAANTVADALAQEPRLASAASPRTFIVTVPAYSVVQESSMRGLMAPRMRVQRLFRTFNYHPAQCIDVDVAEPVGQR